VARVIKEEERAVKRNEILDAAQQLVYTKGYELMSVQNVLEALQISKGAFYHYFGSKQALLDGMLERILEQVEQLLQPVIDDPALTALEKLHRYFSTAARWKTTRKSFMLALLKVWYTDPNAIVRQKQQTMMIRRVAPLVTAIIQQGVAEGVFATAYPEDTSEILMRLLAGMGDSWAEILLADPPPPDPLPSMRRLTAAYTEAMERILGVPAGRLKLIDEATLKAWAPVDGS
jgi:AcrR family transcriptional regulator